MTNSVVSDQTLHSVASDLGLHGMFGSICPILWVNTTEHFLHLGPVVQSDVRLTSSLVVKLLTVLVSTISNSHVFLLKKCE